MIMLGKACGRQYRFIHLQILLSLLQAFQKPGCLSGSHTEYQEFLRALPGQFVQNLLLHGGQHSLICGHRPSAGTTAHQQSFPFQLRQGTLHGVGVHLSLSRQFPNGGHFLSGSQFPLYNRPSQGLYNLLVQLLGRDKVYGLENPGHRKIRQVYEANGLTIRPIGLDDSGASHRDLTRSHVDVLHISPGHQYPTGIVMPIVRRRQLMAWVSGGDRWIIEDDYDSEFRFSGRVVPSMYSMDALGRVIYLNTFSRTITPALRISYMILPKGMMARYHRLLGFYSCTVPSFEQLTLARFLDEGYFEKHVNRMRRHYRLLRDRFLTLLRQSALSDRMTVRGHEAGLHFLLELDTGLPDPVIEQTLADGGIRAASLTRFETGPAAEAARGRVVIQYTDLAEADLPGVVELLEGLVIQ